MIIPGRLSLIINYASKYNTLILNKNVLNINNYSRKISTSLPYQLKKGNLISL